MTRFSITPALHTGIAELDQDHQKLIDHINDIAAKERSSNHEVVLRALAEFRAELIDHFRTEETRLEAANYPLLHAHARHHSEILAALDRLMEDIRKDEPIEGRAAFICFHELVSVVLLRDMHFINWMEDKKLRCS